MASNYLRWYLRQAILVLNDGEFLAHTDFSWTKGKTPSGSTSFTALNGGAYSISDSNRTYSYDVSHAEGETLNYFTVTGTGTVTMDEASVRSSSPDEISYNGRNYKYLYTQTFRRVSSGGKNVAEFLQNSAENGGALPFTYNGNWVYVYPIYVRKPIVTFKDADGTILKTEEVDAGWNVKGVATPPTLSPEKGYSASWSGDYENVTADTDVTAKYTRTDYFVTFNANGATAGTMAEQAFKVGASQALTANAFQKVFSISFKFPDGSTTSKSSAARFLGWAKTAAGSPIWKDKQTVSVSADTLVYASWGRGEAVTLPTSESIAAGKVLKWYSSNDFAASSFVGNAGDSYTPTAGVTLYGREEDTETPASNVGDYEYVIGADVDDEHPHGDMDRILINGEIMPLRTGASETTGVEKKRILRGEDVVFLMEWARQRIAAIDAYEWVATWDGENATNTSWSHDYAGVFKSGYAPAFDFSRKVSASQLNNIPLVYQGYAAITAVWFFGYLVDVVKGLSETVGFAEDCGGAKVAGLPTAAAGNALSRQSVLGYLSAFQGMQDSGVHLGQEFRSKLIMRYFGYDDLEGKVTEFSRLEYGFINRHSYSCPNYGASEGDDGSRQFGLYEKVLDYSGVLLKIHAPHASKVVAVCKFVCFGDISYNQTCVLYLPVEMAMGEGGFFTLSGSRFSGVGFIDELIEASGVDVEATVERPYETQKFVNFGAYSFWDDKKHRISTANYVYGAIYPVVFFDDHTKIS